MPAYPNQLPDYLPNKPPINLQSDGTAEIGGWSGSGRW